jgi:hypothetical protein
VQSNIDIVFVPDKILWWLWDLLPVVYDNIWTLWSEIVEWIEDKSDIAYIVSYAITVIALIVYVNPWIGIFTIPWIVVKALDKFWLSAKTLAVLEKNLNGNMENLVNQVSHTINMAKWTMQNTSKILERWRNITDSANTWTKRFSSVSDDIVKSREVLKKTILHIKAKKI